jgi:hypothetical protein
LHPSSALIIWLASVLSVHFLGYGGLAVLAISLLPGSLSVCRPWIDYVRRARWLLLTLWLILAYNTPGDAFHDIAWAPTYQGMAEANLQAVRLIVMLGCLAWLFSRLGRDGLVSAMWGVAKPLQRFGLDAQRVVVRLSLVLANLQVPQQKGDWRKMLAGDTGFDSGPDVLHLSMPLWRARDSLLAAAAMLLLAGVIVL